MKKLKTRAISAFLAIAMTATMLPTAFAENGAELEATVFMTVSNQGILAVDNDGAAMAGREVVVTDLDSDGKLTYHEALIAAHKTYHSEDGYSAPGGYVGELWGAETTNALFFINDEGLATGVSEDTIADGDRLTASINRDNTYYADWYSFFDVPEKSVAAGEEFSLILKGHLGMAYTDEDKVDAALGGISVGLWENGAFSEIEATDDEGRVTLSFAEEGTYYISAQGSVEDVVTDYSLMNMSTDDAPVFGVMDLTTYETQMAYTETDYGDGPYPADEVKYVDFEVWNESQDTYHTLKSNQLIADCPIIAPACVVTVAGDAPQMSDAEAAEVIYSEFSKTEYPPPSWRPLSTSWSAVPPPRLSPFLGLLSCSPERGSL